MTRVKRELYTDHTCVKRDLFTSKETRDVSKKMYTHTGDTRKQLTQHIRVKRDLFTSKETREMSKEMHTHTRDL